MSDIRKEGGDSSVARLIRLAGARDVPAEDAMQRARKAAYAAWQRGLETTTQTPRRKRLPWWPLALAASCALVAVLLMNQPAKPALRVVANVVAVDMHPVVHAATQEYLAPKMQLLEGSRVDTGDG